MHHRTLFAPQIDNMIRSPRSWEPDIYLPLDTAATQLFDVLDNIEPLGEDGFRLLWIPAERGPITAFGHYDELYEDGEYQTYQEFEQSWLSSYPDETVWYKITCTEYDDCRHLFINGRFCIRFANDNHTNNPEYYVPLMNWLMCGAQYCVIQCKNDSYNTIIREKLPFDMRTGTILRRDVWDIFPENKDIFLNGIHTEDIQRFTQLFSSLEEGTVLNKKLPTLTSGEYFKACMLGYEASGYACPKMDATPLDWCIKYADFRHHGLRDLDQNSPEDFEAWMDSKQAEGHTWEVRPGHGFSWMHLFPRKDEGGWSFNVSGANYWSCIQAIHFALALYDAELPVSVLHARQIAHMANGKDLIGIVPRYRLPVYCSDLFQDKDIIDYMRLPYEQRDKIIKKAHWFDLPTVHIKASS